VCPGKVVFVLFKGYIGSFELISLYKDNKEALQKIKENAAHLTFYPGINFSNATADTILRMVGSAGKGLMVRCVFL